MDFETAQALHDVAMADDRVQAAEAFKRHLTRLSDWRVVYADDSAASRLQTRRCKFPVEGCASSLFRGTSLWLIDADVAQRRQAAAFFCGAGTYLDSNAASVIRSIAYHEQPAPELLAKGRMLGEFVGLGVTANPFLYLWESQRHWTGKTIERCRQAFAANHALGLARTLPDLAWGRQFRAAQRQEAEAVADAYLADFQRQLDSGLGCEINEIVELIEAVLTRAKFLEYSSRKSPQHKLNELIRFMHEELSTIMTRELIVCADILGTAPQSRLSQKLKGVRNGADPFALLRNCAWDLFLPRALDMLAGADPVDGLDFYLPHIITFDADVADILRLTELRAVALHRESRAVYPYFDIDPAAWLSGQVGEKRSAALEPLFGATAYGQRQGRRDGADVRRILASDRVRLQALLDGVRT
ncbi:hypothetical protein [Massilia sp. Root418]|uniref:hypothetical protein n=1 Tax=Massilia sp. Root418 TaxID=1736532 RepID=UPI000B24C59C|nr:hypothetical protein [Massilia sp. Root418]